MFFSLLLAALKFGVFASVAIMAFLIGAIIGGIVGVYILYWLWEFALFKRVVDDPLKGKLASVLAAYLTAGTIGGFGGADGGPHYWAAFIQYLPGLLVVGILAYRRGRELREELASGELQDHSPDGFQTDPLPKISNPVHSVRTGT